MGEFIPPLLYAKVYFNVLLVLLLAMLLHTLTLEQRSLRNVRAMNGLGWVLLVVVLAFIGTRPNHPVFTDMPLYSAVFHSYQAGKPMEITEDKGFLLLNEICAELMNLEGYYLVVACLYVLPIFFATRRWMGQYWAYGFAMACFSISFFAYGTNTIRNGMATSIFILAISFWDKKWLMIGLMVLGSFFHKSLLLPIAAFGAASVFPKPRVFLAFWVASIFLSLLFSGYWESLFANLGFGDDRTSYLTTKADPKEFRRVGFRWDFVLYSFFGVAAGWYYIFKRDYQERFYHIFYCTFLMANAFWILVIRANFSDRFSYLSWFMLGLVIVYPLGRENLMPNQNRFASGLLFFYFLFTYLVNFVYLK
jgi:EpsG family